MSRFKTVLFILLILIGVWAGWSYITGYISEQKQQQYGAGYDEGYDAGFRDGQYEAIQIGVDQAEYERVLADYNNLLNDYNNLVNEANARLNSAYQTRQSVTCNSYDYGFNSSTITCY